MNVKEVQLKHTAGNKCMLAENLVEIESLLSVRTFVFPHPTPSRRNVGGQVVVKVVKIEH